MNNGKKIFSKQINQHWVPRFYLNEFSTPETRDTKNPQVWFFSRHNGDPQKVNTKKIAVKHYLYSPENEKGNRCWRVEEKLASLESMLSSYWCYIARDFVDLDAEGIRKAISLFIATLILRNPIKIDEYRYLQEQLVTFFEGFPKDTYGRPNISQIETKHGTFNIDTSDWFNYRTPTKYSQNKFFVERIGQNSIEIATLLLAKRWSVLISEKPCFITTDHPVAMVHKEKEIFGLETKGTIISFPLSPTRVLMLDDEYGEPDSQYYPLSSDGSAPINIIHWRCARNFMFSHRHSDEVNYEMVSFANKYEQKT